MSVSTYLPTADETVEELKSNTLLAVLVARVHIESIQGFDGMDFIEHLLKWNDCDGEEIYFMPPASLDEKMRLVPYLRRIGFGVKTFIDDDADECPFSVDYPGHSTAIGKQGPVRPHHGTYFYPRSVRQARMWGLLFCSAKLKVLAARVRAKALVHETTDPHAKRRRMLAPARRVPPVGPSAEWLLREFASNPLLSLLHARLKVEEEAGEMGMDCRLAKLRWHDGEECLYKDKIRGCCIKRFVPFLMRLGYSVSDSADPEAVFSVAFRGRSSPKRTSPEVASEV
jgi:hypothetical protein